MKFAAFLNPPRGSKFRTSGELENCWENIDKQSDMPAVGKAMVDFYRDAHHHPAVLFVQFPNCDFGDTVSRTMPAGMLDVGKINPGNRREIDYVIPSFVFVDAQP